MTWLEGGCLALLRRGVISEKQEEENGTDRKIVS